MVVLLQPPMMVAAVPPSLLLCPPPTDDQTPLAVLPFPPLRPPHVSIELGTFASPCAHVVTTSVLTAPLFRALGFITRVVLSEFESIAGGRSARARERSALHAGPVSAPQPRRDAYVSVT